MTGNRTLMVAAAAAIVSLVAMGAVLVQRVNVTQRFREQTAQTCRTTEALKSAIRLVFQDYLGELEKRRAQISASDYAAVREYYERQLKRFAASACPEA